MKKKVLKNLLMSTLLLSYGGTLVFADSSVGTTETDATFTAGERPEPGIPGEGPNEPGPLDPDPDPTNPSEPKPLPETGNVYVTHLPDITFGSNKTNLKTTEYNALTEKRTANQGADVIYMPHSVQVADLSGSNATKWKVGVQQKEAFKTSGTTPLTLKNTRIRIYGNTLTSSANAAADLVGKVTGVAMDQTDASFGKHSVIPVANDEGGELVVLNNPTAGFTVNSYTTSIFTNNYVSEDYSTEKTPTASKYEGVKLNVPASDQSQAESYKGALTWTLTVEP